jgi:hypothetical protein
MIYQQSLMTLILMQCKYFVYIYLNLNKLMIYVEIFGQCYIAGLKVKLNANNIVTDDDGCEDLDSNSHEDFESTEENEDSFILNNKPI